MKSVSQLSNNIYERVGPLKALHAVQKSQCGMDPNYPMEFQKHLVVSLETGEIEKWLTPELIEAGPIDVTVAPYVVPKKRVLKALLHRIFLTLLVQVMTTITIGTLTIYHNPMEDIFGPTNLHLKVVTSYYFLSIVVLTPMIPVRHKYPWSFIFLTVLTLGSSLAASTYCCRSWRAVIAAIGVTLTMAVLLFVYAVHTNMDYTICGNLAFYGLAVTFLLGMGTMIYDLNGLAQTHAVIGVLVFTLFFLYDLQIMMGRGPPGDGWINQRGRYIFISANIYVNFQMMFYYYLVLLKDI